MSSGTIRRSTGMPWTVVARAPAVPDAADLVDRLQRAERLDQRGRIVGAGHDVQVLAGLGPAARAARQLHADGGRVLAQRAPPSPRRPPAPWTAGCAAGSSPSAPAASAASTFSSALAPKPGDRAQPLGLGGRLRSSSDVMPSWSCSSLRALGPQARDAGDLHEAGRDALAQLLRGRDLAGRQQRVDLLRDRLADAAQLRRPALRGQLGHRLAGVADRLRGVAVGQHAVDDRAVQLVQRPQLVEGGGDLGVLHRHGGCVGYAPMSGVWLVLPTYNEAENLETSFARCSRTWRPPGGSTACSSSTTARPTAPAGSPTGWPAEIDQVEVLHRTSKDGIGPGLPGRLRRGAGARRRAGDGDGLRLLPRPGRPAPRWSRPPRTPTWCWARATCRAAG